MSVKQEIRSLQKLGGSLALYLPKEWCDMNNLTRGSKVRVRYVDRFLCVETEREEKREAVIDLDDILDADLKYALISLYVLGFDRVRLSSKKKISLAIRRHIISLLNYTPGYEIVEEGENFVDIAIAREVEDPAKALSREFNSVSTLFKYSIEALERAPNIPDEYVDAIEELDDEVDRTWFEVERTVYKNVGRAYLKSVESRSMIHLLLVSRYLERLSDHIVQLVQEIHASPVQQYETIAQIRSLLISYHNIIESFKAVLEERKSARDTNTITRLINVIENKKSYKHSIIPRLRKEGGTLVAYHVMRIYDYITDIAEVVTNVILDSLYSKT
ncbi:MAG: phosphate uptake regulator PhoU [Sulfolobales archaeon]